VARALWDSGIAHCSGETYIRKHRHDQYLPPKQELDGSVDGAKDLPSDVPGVLSLRTSLYYSGTNLQSGSAKLSMYKEMMLSISSETRLNNSLN